MNGNKPEQSGRQSDKKDGGWLKDEQRSSGHGGGEGSWTGKEQVRPDDTGTRDDVDPSSDTTKPRSNS